MKKDNLKHSIGKKCLLLTFFVLFSQFISENVIAQPNWKQSFVQVSLNAKKDGIAIVSPFYIYSFRLESVHAFLKSCEFEASVNGSDYFKLMDIFTQRQTKTNFTTIAFNNKLRKAKIIFKKEAILPTGYAMWPEFLRFCMEIMIPNVESGTKAVFALIWFLDDAHKDVRFIRISGIWQVDGLQPEYFNDVVYDLKRPGQSELKSNTPDLNVKISKKDIIKVFKNQKLS